MSKITFADICQALEFGNEIEMTISEYAYFLQPFYDEPLWDDDDVPIQYNIYDCSNLKSALKIFTGTIEEILEYKFQNKFTLKNNFDVFFIEYIF